MKNVLQNLVFVPNLISNYLCFSILWCFEKKNKSLNNSMTTNATAIKLLHSSDTFWPWTENMENIWFEQDGCPALHNARDLQYFLRENFDEKSNFK